MPEAPRTLEGSYYSSRLVIEAEGATHTRVNGRTLVYDLNWAYSTTTKTSGLSVIGTRALTLTVNCACCKWLGAHCGSSWDQRMETKIQALSHGRQGSDGKLQYQRHHRATVFIIFIACHSTYAFRPCPVYHTS